MYGSFAYGGSEYGSKILAGVPSLVIFVAESETVTELVTVLLSNVRVQINESETVTELVLIQSGLFIRTIDSETEFDVVNIETVDVISVNEVEVISDKVSNIEIIDEGIIVSDIESTSEFVTIRIPLLGLISALDSELINEYVLLVLPRNLGNFDVQLSFAPAIVMNVYSKQYISFLSFENSIVMNSYSGNYDVENSIQKTPYVVRL